MAETEERLFVLLDGVEYEVYGRSSVDAGTRANDLREQFRLLMTSGGRPIPIDVAVEGVSGSTQLIVGPGIRVAAVYVREEHGPRVIV